MPDLASIRFAQEEEGGAPASAFRRVDELAAAAPGRAAWACEAGCNFCCHLKVNVTPGEAAALAARLDPERRAVVAAHARLAAGLSAAAYRRARIPCAMLDADGRCSVYDVRPLSCRAHTSTSRAVCEQAFLDEATTDDIPLDRWLVRVVDAVRAGMGDEKEQELHAALVDALGARCETE